MRWSRLLAGIGCILLFSGCISYRPKTKSLARIKVGNFERRGLTDWDQFSIREIDGQRLGMAWSESQSIKIDSGDRLLVVSYLGNREFFGPFLSSDLVPVPCKLKEGAEYEVSGQAKHGVLAVFVRERKSKEPASPAVLTPLREVSKSSGMPVFVPIYAPVN